MYIVVTLVVQGVHTFVLVTSAQWLARRIVSQEPLNSFSLAVCGVLTWSCKYSVSDLLSLLLLLLCVCGVDCVSTVTIMPLLLRLWNVSYALAG